MLWEVKKAAEADRVAREVVCVISFQGVSKKWLQDFVLMLIRSGIDLRAVGAKMIAREITEQLVESHVNFVTEVLPKGVKRELRLIVATCQNLSRARLVSLSMSATNIDATTFARAHVLTRPISIAEVH